MAQKSGSSLVKIGGTILAVVAAFLVLRFVMGVALSITKFFFIGVAIVVVAWLFLKDDPKSGSGSG